MVACTAGVRVLQCYITDNDFPLVPSMADSRSMRGGRSAGRTSQATARKVAKGKGGDRLNRGAMSVPLASCLWSALVRVESLGMLSHDTLRHERVPGTCVKRMRSRTDRWYQL